MTLENEKQSAAERKSDRATAATAHINEHWLECPEWTREGGGLATHLAAHAVDVKFAMQLLAGSAEEEEPRTVALVQEPRPEAAAPPVTKPPRPLQPELRCQREGWCYGITHATTSIGRRGQSGPQADLILGGGKAISRRAAVIALSVPSAFVPILPGVSGDSPAVNAPELKLECVGKSKVCVNGARLAIGAEPVALSANDIITIGEVVLELVFPTIDAAVGGVEGERRAAVAQSPVGRSRRRVAVSPTRPATRPAAAEPAVRAQTAGENDSDPLALATQATPSQLTSPMWNAVEYESDAPASGGPSPELLRLREQLAEAKDRVAVLEAAEVADGEEPEEEDDMCVNGEEEGVPCNCEFCVLADVYCGICVARKTLKVDVVICMNAWRLRRLLHFWRGLLPEPPPLPPPLTLRKRIGGGYAILYEYGAGEGYGAGELATLVADGWMVSLS